MRIIAFAERNIKELLRDPLSYVFCLAFPIVMLIIMTIVNNSIPPEAKMTIFRIDNLSAGTAVFGLTFLMLLSTLLTSKDRSSSFLMRLYASPMTSVDFIAGYYVPLFILAVLQCVITFGASMIIAVTQDTAISIGGVLLAIASLIPTMLLFIGFGVFFGGKFSENAAPGLCSVIISAASILGGIWMDIDGIGGGFATVCKVLPFYHSVTIARHAVDGTISECGTSMLIVLAYMAVVTVLAVLGFRKNMKQ